MAKLTINDEKKNVPISIQEVNAGEIFNCEGEYFIMTDDDDHWLGVNLSTGTKIYFYRSELVIPVNATLIIE